MRIAYLECFAGLSGDMLVAALLDAGVEQGVFEEATAAMKLGASLRVERVDRSGISSLKVHVLEGGRPAEETAAHRHEAAGAAGGDGSGKRGGHGRSLSVIRRMIEGSALEARVIGTAVRAFELLGEAEARIHNVGIERIHFHEVGAVDAIVDMVAASAGLHALGAERWMSSPVNVGGGMVECAHGRFPVPAPAAADLLRGMPTYSAHVEMELVTPTGAALLRALVEEKGLTFGPQPAMRSGRIGYGAGSRNPSRFPNVVRLTVGEAAEAGAAGAEGEESETVMVLETALDDMSPQVVAHVAQTALARGALDAMLTPVVMKKGRAGTLLTILCRPEDGPGFERLLFEETSTLGVRMRTDRRSCLGRGHVMVATEFGRIRVKVGSRGAETLNANPEFEDCRAAAEGHKVPLKQVQQAAMAAYVGRPV